MAFDSGRNRLVALQPSANGLDVVEYDGQVWNQRNNPIAATAGLRGACYDSVRREVVVQYQSPDRTLAWNGDKWILKSTQTPSPAYITNMVFHSIRQTVMAIAWSGIATTSMELWEWDGVAWSRVAIGSPLPTGHLFESLAYDPVRNRLVTYGPYGPHPFFGSIYLYHTHTFEWDDVSGWVRVSDVGPALTASSLVYDEARGRTVLTIRVPNGSQYQCWERNGKGPWSQSISPPGFAVDPVYDSVRRRVLVVSGAPQATQSLYAYQPVHPAPFTTFAPGCPGPLGTPAITLSAPHTAAWIGDSLQVTVSRLPGAFAGLFLGYSNTTASGTPLPWDLGPVGMPNCSLRVSPDAMWLCSGAGTQCTVSIPVPNSAALLDRDVYLQAVVPAPTTNAAGLVVSDAAVARVGSR